MYVRFRLRTLLLVLSGLLVLAWLIPPYFHAGRYRRVLQSQIARRLGRPVHLGAVRFRLLPQPGFSMDNVVIEEDTGFGWEPFVRVGSVDCDLRWRSLWTSNPDCSRIVLDHPTVDVVRNARGQWNIGMFLRSSKDHVRPPGPAATEFTLEADDARINFTLGGRQGPLMFDQVQAQVEFDPTPRSIRFDLSGVPQRTDLPLPPPGQVELSGAWNARGGFRARISTHSSLLYGWIPLLTGHDAGIYGLADASIELAGSLERIAIQGHAHLDQLHRWGDLPPDTSIPVDLDFSGSWNRSLQELMISRLDAAFSSSHIHVTGALTGLLSHPRTNVVIAVQRSRLEDVISLAARLSGRRPSLGAAGRLDGLLTVQGPWAAQRYAGLLAVRGMTITAGDASFSVPEASVQIDREGAHLVPLRFQPEPGLTCLVQGNLSPILPNAAWPSAAAHKSERAPSGAYALSMTLRQAPLHGLLRLAAALHIAEFRDLDARGAGDATVRLTGKAWPFARPRLTANGDVLNASLLVPGLTEPLQVTRFHFQAIGRRLRIAPLAVRLGRTTFSGWLERGESGNDPWRFDVRTSRLSLQQGALWFAVLGYRQPSSILDFIPGLRSLAARRLAGRELFSSVNAHGTFESPEVTFRSLKLDHFQADVSIAERLAQISKAHFNVDGGHGQAEARVDFRSRPATITGDFQLAALDLRRAARRLPPELAGLEGLLSAQGTFSTRGLSSGEMGANLHSEVKAHVKDVSFGSFDPLQAMARALPVGAFELDPGKEVIPSASFDFAIRGPHVTLRPARLTLAGATLDARGDYSFGGIANLYIQSDLGNLGRPGPNPAAPQPPGPAQAASAKLRLSGPINKLALVRQVESARAVP